MIYFLALIITLSGLTAWALKNHTVNVVLDSVSQLIERKIYSIEASTWLWITAFLSITFMRDFLENYIEYSSTVVNLNIRYEFTICWIVIFLALSLFIHLISGETLTKISKLVVFSFLVTFIAPPFDALYYRGHEFGLGYVLSEPLKNFLTFFSLSKYGYEATMGIRVEIFTCIVIAIIYTASKTRSWARTIIAGLGVYTILFLWMAIPAVYQAAYNIFPDALSSLSMKQIPGRLKYPEGYNIILSSLLFALSAIYLWLMGPLTVANALKIDLASFRIRAHSLSAVIKNIRPFRATHYCTLVLLGFAIGYNISGIEPSSSHLLQVLILCIATIFAWAFAVGVNDIYDQQIDMISNPDRPLIKNKDKINATEYTLYAMLFAIISILLAWQVSYVSASIIFYYCAYYSYAYSAPPLRLRQYLILPNILIGICCLLSLLLGFSIFYRDQTFAEIPRGIAFFVFLAFSCASTIKDLKDYEGDKAQGIHTLPTLFGRRKARLVIALLIGSMFALSPLFFDLPYLWIYSSIFAVAAFSITLKKNEKYIFTLWFTYVALLCLQLLFTNNYINGLG